MNAPTTMPAVIAASPVFASVPFRDTEILAARVDGQVRVPMKPFCGTIGLEWEPQRKRILRNPVLSEGASMMEVPSAGGVQAQMTLPLELLVGFLFTAESRRYAPHLRERVVLFQRECFGALHQHFFGQAAAAPAARSIAWQELDAARRSAPALITLISAETRPEVRRYLYELLQHDADRLGVPVPALADLGDARTPADRINELLEGLETLTARGVRWNHLGTRTNSSNGRMAVVLPELQRLFAQHDIDVVIDDELRSALRASSRRYRLTRRQIRSTIRRAPVLATVIEPWPMGELA